MHTSLRDKVVTRFCESVTPRCEETTSHRPAIATTVVGEVMAPVSVGNSMGAGAKPSFLAVLACALLACGDDGRPAPHGARRPVQTELVADPALGQRTDLDGVAPVYGEGLLAELTGDEVAARTSYEAVLASSDAPAHVAARAALHLAQLEARADKSGRARDLIARATALAPNDPTIVEGADRVRAEIVAASGAGDIRGPKLGTPLPGAPPKVAAAFAAAEQALARVHAMRPRQRLAVWEKEDATGAVVRRYRTIAEAGGIAQVAAEYRIGSLYHDLALSLMFEPVAADLRRTLFTGARTYMKKAATAYRASLAATATPEAQLWRDAAETDLRAATDVLGEASR